MHFISTIVAGLVAVAYAQDPTNTEATDPTTTVDPVQASILACLERCNAGDVNCEAACVTVPNPSEEMVSMNNECIGNCPQGNGTEAEIAAYRSCRDACIASFFYTDTGIPAAATDPTNTNTADGADATEDADDSNGSNGDSEDADGDGTNGDTNGDGNGAGVAGVSGAAFGLAAFLAALVTL